MLDAAPECVQAMKASLVQRPVLAVWLLVATATTLPYVVAPLQAPPGQAFQGFFFFVDDHYLYLSYAQQAEDGAFLFRNKLVAEPHRASLVNLEWWLVGRLSRILGRNPFAAYRVVGALLALVFLIAVHRWLRLAGLPRARRLWALLLVCLGGSFGGLLYATGLLEPRRALDMATGLFPALGLLANPHFTAGTALLLLALEAFLRGDARGNLTGILLGSALALVRPYDVVLLILVRGLGIVFSRPASAWFREALPMAGLLPVIAFDYWAFYMNPAFAFYARAPYAFPRLEDLALALGPAVLAAALAFAAPPADRGAVTARRHLIAWLVVGALVVVLRPVHFSLQFLVGIGAPLLILASLGLARFRPAVLWTSLVVLGTTPIFTLAILLQPLPHWYTAEARLLAATALQPLCAPDDLVLAPPDIGLFVGGLSACKPWVSHPSHPDHPARVAATEAFYGRLAPASRAALLDRERIRHVVLPQDAGEIPEGWLGVGTPFRRSAAVGAPGRRIALYSRATGPSPGRAP